MSKVNLMFVDFLHFFFLTSYKVIGFLLLIVGMDVYNNLLIVPYWKKFREGRQMRERDQADVDDERQRLLGTGNLSC